MSTPLAVRCTKLSRTMLHLAQATRGLRFPTRGLRFPLYDGCLLHPIATSRRDAIKFRSS